jgi:hypothetical protein
MQQGATKTIFSCNSPGFEVNIQLNNTNAFLFRETPTDFTIITSHLIRVNVNVTVIVD